MPNKLQRGKGRSGENNFWAISVVKARDGDAGLVAVETEHHVGVQEMLWRTDQTERGLVWEVRERERSDRGDS